jgi:hypothetical protein
MTTKLSKRKSNRLDITERDVSILKCLWKWKLISTTGLAVKFFPEASVRTAYRRLLCLASSGYLSFVQINHTFGEGWTLSPKGYKFIRHLLGDLKVDGYKSEYPHHDRLVTALHLGDWLIEQPEYTQTFSEQQLRRIPVDLWDEWLPKSDTHRPDGYSLLFYGEKEVVVAFEVELWLKSKSRYEPLVAFYDIHSSIDTVLWLVDSKVTLNSLKRTFEAFQIREMSKHNFILLPDFQRLGWRAPFVAGKHIGKTPSDLLLHLPHARATPGPRCGVTLPLLNNSKKPVLT